MQVTRGKAWKRSGEAATGRAAEALPTQSLKPQLCSFVTHFFFFQPVKNQYI